MRKKEPNSSNLQLLNSSNILYNLTAKNFQRCRIDSMMMATINNFIFNLGEKFSRNNSNQITNQVLKIAVQVIIAFESNLQQRNEDHAWSHDDLINFFVNTVILIEKITMAWNDFEKLIHTDLINLLWFLLDNKVEEVKLPQLEKKMEFLNTLVLTSENTFNKVYNYEAIVYQFYSLVSKQCKLTQNVQILFISFLRQSKMLQNFKLIMGKYLNQCLVSNHLNNFKKALSIYQHLGDSGEQRRINLENLILKILQSNYGLHFIIEINQLKNFTKLFSEENTPKILIKIIEKIIEKPTFNNQIIKLLQQLSQTSIILPSLQLKENIFQKVQFKFDGLLIRIVDWILNRNFKKDEELEIKQKSLQESELKEERIIQFVKKLSNHRNNYEGQSDTMKDQYQRACTYLSTIIKNICEMKCLKMKFSALDLDSLPFFRHEKINNQIVKKFILDILPYIMTDFNFTIKERTPLKLAIVLKKAELDAKQLFQAGNSLQKKFNECYFQMMHPDSLNYHVALCFIYLRYQSDKQAIANFLIDEMMKDLSLQGKNKTNRNLIINMGFLLKSLDYLFNAQPIKFKVRELMKNSEHLVNGIDINQIIDIYPKETSILKTQNYKFTDNYFKFKQKLNKQFENYSKNSINIFYSLIIAINDMMEINGVTQYKSELLSEITFMRKINYLGQVYTIMRLFIEKIKEYRQSGQLAEKKNIIFLILMKLQANLRANPNNLDNEDLGEGIEQLKSYILLCGQYMNIELIQALDHFKNNKNLYKSDKYLEYIGTKSFIKFYSQACVNYNSTHIIFMRVALNIFKKCLQAKNISVDSLENQFKHLYMMYLFEQSPKEFKFTEKHQNQIKSYLLLLMLEDKINKKQKLTQIISKIQANFATIRQITLQTHYTDHISLFRSKIPFDFIKLCSNIIINVFCNDQQSNLQLFKFVIFFIEEDKKQNCNCFYNILRDVLQKQISNEIIQLLIKRVNFGLELQENRKNNYFNISIILYKLISNVIDKNKQHLLNLVQDLIQIDYYSDCQKSSLILKEISNIFIHIEQKNNSVCQTIFNYIITLAEIFPGQEKLQISNFICNFFGLSVSSNLENSIEAFEKQVNYTCNNQANYKCLKCDDKKLVCFACAITCHKGHPVCYLNVPPEIRSSKCMCRDIQFKGCKLIKDNENPNSLNYPNKFRNQYKPLGYPTYLGSQNSRQYSGDRYRYTSNNIPKGFREQFEQQNERIQLGNYLHEEELEHQLRMGSRWHEASIKDEFIPRMSGGRIDRLFDRGDDFSSQPYRVRDDRGEPNRLNNFNSFLKEKEKEKEKELFREEAQQPNQNQFIDQSYQQNKLKMEIEQSCQFQEDSAILKKYALLPKFIDLMVSFCTKKASKDKVSNNLDLWKVNFVNPTVQKIMQVSFKAFNSGTFHLQVQKQNPLNISCVLIKKNLAYNNKYVLIGSGHDVYVYNKQKFFISAQEMKLAPGFNSKQKQNINYAIHSIQFSVTDPSLFCVSGLHNLALYNISNEGNISRTTYRYNVNNLYINKIKMTKIGIFIGLEKEIRVLNFTCKPILTIKPQEANTLIRQWSIFEKSAGCQIYFVCPNGNIFYTDILPSDEGKKEFTSRVTDQRKNKNNTGASVFAKDLPNIGKYLFASFKDGYNIVGRLEGDIMEDMTDIRLKGIKTDKNTFDTNFIIGHIDIIKLPQIDEVYVVCTVKKYFPPEMAFNQGFLCVVKMKKQGNSELQILVQQSTCEYFQVFYLGARHFIIVSLHTDGSMHIHSPTKILKALVQQEFKKIKEDQSFPSNSNQSKNQIENYDKIRKSLESQISLTKILDSKIQYNYCFRQNSDQLKSGLDYAVIKSNEIQYEFKQLKFNRIVTGMSLPYFGKVELPTRTIQNVIQFGFTHSQALYFYAQGVIRFKYIKDQQNKYIRQNINIANNNARMLEKLQRIQKLNQYAEHQKISHPSMMNSLLGIKQDTNLQIYFISKSFENFKSKISKFDQHFNTQSDDESSSIEKTSLIIKMFLSRGLKQGNPCSKDQILQLVDAIKSIISDAPKRLYKLLKQIIKLSIKVYQKICGVTLQLTDQNYALKAATQNRLVHYYNQLKLDMSDQQLNEFLEFLIEILDEDLQLMGYYMAKYSGMLNQLHKRLKKADTEERAIALVQIYSIAYPVLKFCDIPCSWIIGSFCSIVYSYINCKNVREKLYEGLKNNKYLILQNLLKNVCNNDGIEQIDLIIKQVQNAAMQDEGAKDPTAQIYQMFNRGQIDDDALIKLLTQASKIQYEKAQEINQKPIQQAINNIGPQEQRLMQEQQIVTQVHNAKLIVDLIDGCTDNFIDSLDVILSRIITLYVVSKVIDAHFGDLTLHLLKRIRKMVSEIDIKSENQKLTSVQSYACLFNRIISTSQYMKGKNSKKDILYQQILKQIDQKLSKIQLEKITKIKSPPNLLPKIFKGEKPSSNIHVSYALTNLMQYPCSPSHILLSLECYWLLPESKQFYSKQKDQSSIRDGINSGNITKVLEIAKKNPKIWQQTDEYLQFIEKWINDKKQNWELALELLALYYEN